jgi:hypothetical protein
MKKLMFWRAEQDDSDDDGAFAVALTMMKMLCSFLLLVIFGACVLNFILFAHTVKFEAGHYFMCNHGCWEITEESYTYARWHGRTISITHPLAVICGFLWNLMNNPAWRRR